MRRDKLFAVLTPIVFGILFLLVWELFVVVRDIKPYLLPKPSAIWGQFHGNFTFIRKATRVTGTNAFAGLLLGVAFGSVTAFAASRFKLLNELISPTAVAVSAMPIIVLVAIFNDLFAITSEIPRRLMVAVVVFFLVFINVSKGLTQADATQLELMRSYGASESAIIRKVRVPHALSYFFVALRQAAPLAVVTAFVSEYFGGLQNGLGSRITQSIANSKDAAGWAYVVGACLLGLTFFLLSVALERVAMPWKARRSRR
jgi:NitT/TauT family transport system permease protein